MNLDTMNTRMYLKLSSKERKRYNSARKFKEAGGLTEFRSVKMKCGKIVNSSIWVTDSELHQSRLYASQSTRGILKALHHLAPHVDKYQYIKDTVKRAEKIESGKLDTNLTTWQSMNFYFTKECIGFLP